MNSMHQTSKSSEKTDLTIIIVNHNTQRLLLQCLQSIYDTVEGLNVEIFVVDNASSDGSQEMIRSQFPQIQLIANSQALGFTRAVNLALPKGKGDYFLLAHPDIKFLPGAIHEMLSFLASHLQTGVVGGNLLYPDGAYNPCSITRRSVRRELVEFVYTSFRGIHKRLPWFHQRLNKTWSSFFWDHETNMESEVIWNACMMFKRDVLDAVGSFCEDFYIWFADVDWCYRAKSAGWRMYYLVEPKVIHYEARSGDFIDREEVRYKVRPSLVADKVSKDRHVLLKRHYSLFFLWFFKTVEIVSLWIMNSKLALLRVFSFSR